MVTTRLSSGIIGGSPDVSMTTIGDSVNMSVATAVGSVMQQLTQLVQTQTAMVAAQTRAMSAQSLPPMSHYSGESSHSSEDDFDKWIEQFEKRAKLVGWSEYHHRFHLRMLLDGSAFQSEDVKASYSATIDALKTRFKPVDIEELWGMEFHQLFQKNQSIEELIRD